MAGRQDASQHQAFAYEAIPTMFHSQTREFLTYLQRDGLKFLEFWWDQAGRRVPPERHTPFSGARVAMHRIEPVTSIVIVTLPVPREDGDVHYLGLISRPERRFAWVKLPTTRVIALIHRAPRGAPPATELVELTPRGRRVAMGSRPEPVEETFTRVVKRIAAGSVHGH